LPGSHREEMLCEMKDARLTANIW